MKILGYLVYAMFYYLFRLCRIKEDKVFCIMTHDASKDGNVGVVVRALKKSGRRYRFQYMRKQDKRKALSFYLAKPYHMATSKYILQDNVFLPMAFLRFPQGVKVVQLWHGTGTIKKFGQDVNVDEHGKGGFSLAWLEKRANATITHLIVNSEYTKRQYKGAFGVHEDRIHVLGLPRTDSLFREDEKGKGLDRFYKQYPNLKSKTLLLYAPTFRDDEVKDPKVRLDFNYISRHLPKHMALLMRLHPHVAKAYDDGKWGIMSMGNVINVSDYPDLSHLMFAADMLITDYSSIIFEYCLLERPIYFYAYDLEEFEKKGRGFYEKYEAYVPGPVSKSTEELFTQIESGAGSTDEVKRFKEVSYRYLDGKSTDRLLKEVFGIS